MDLSTITVNFKLPVAAWGHTILHAAALIRLRPSGSQSFSPMQLVYGQPPNISLENVCDPEGNRQISAAACRVACPHATTDNLEFSSNGREIH